MSSLTLNLSPTGALLCEGSRNGVRVKLTVSLAELPMQVRDYLQTELQREQAKLAASRDELHRRVATEVTTKFGVDFAARTIGLSPKLRHALRRDGYSAAEIDLMESRGELNGLAIFGSIADRARREAEIEERARQRSTARTQPVRDFSSSKTLAELDL